MRAQPTNSSLTQQTKKPLSKPAASFPPQRQKYPIAVWAQAVATASGHLNVAQSSNMFTLASITKAAVAHGNNLFIKAPI